MEKLDNLEVSDEASGLWSASGLWRSAAAARTDFQQKTLFLFRHGSPRTALKNQFERGIAVLQNGNEEMTTQRTYRQIDATD